ncbi:MAG: type IX secretion system membrane protein PorP/SprF [Burkholderiales bacterium]|nr:type IX secretion system membrane protein PorP/SprF [Bacteroidia bacterium]
MKNIFKIILFLLLAEQLYCQQVVMFSHYFYKPMIYNPAYTGNGDGTNLMLVNHTQWAGFKGGPQYNILTLDGNFINKNTGAGISVISDRKGVNSRVGGNISYSYKLKFKDKIHLLLGLSAGAINQSINYSNAVIENSNDPSLFTNNQSKTTFDANAGLAFICKGLELGFAVPQIANNKISYLSNSDTRTFYTQSRHYMSSIKYKFLLSKAKEISLTPQCLLRYLPNAPMQYDAGLNIDFKNNFWAGATYKSNYAIGLNLGVLLFKRFSIGYSYDYIIGNVSKYSGLSHEIFINFKFIKKVKPKSTIEQEEDEELLRLSKQNLNKLIIQRLLEKIEMVLDKENTTPEDIQELLNEISAFLDDNSTDPAQETLNKYYKSLKNQAKGDLNVLVKGRILLDINDLQNDYSGTINIIDLETKTLIATSNPSKEGKYFIILKPGKKYQIIIEKRGYQKYTRNFNISATSESYELSQEIQLKR